MMCVEHSVLHTSLGGAPAAETTSLCAQLQGGAECARWAPQDLDGRAWPAAATLLSSHK